MQHYMKTNQLTPAQMDELLETELTACFATVNPDNTPYAIPVHFLYRDGRVYIHCLPQGQKTDNILANPSVSLTVWRMSGLLPHPEGNPCRTGTAYRSVVLCGTAQMVEDPARKAEILGGFVSKYTPRLAGTPLPEQRVQGTGVIEITVTALTGKYGN